jgi:hypothetical protein
MTPPFKRGTPYTNEHAKPTRVRKVVNTLAIKLTGMYRNATIRGVFAVYPDKRPFRIHKGKLRVLVDCAWFDDRPGSHALKVELSGSWELLPNYTGEVVDNVGEKGHGKLTAELSIKS